MRTIEKFKSKVIDVERARMELQRLESELRALERELESGENSTTVRSNVPERLIYLLELFTRYGGRLSLNDAAKHAKITRTGVWNQIKKLIELGVVRQVDRGVYELI